mmetsp:Transcript_29494/g.39238  ORF Transcript_29494/g.39238 Transcript_29494/m.39238 type:complete len:140 (-) Transcript_29494:1163-1582(-)
MRVQNALSKQHSIRHVLDDCLWRSVVFKADLVTYFLAQLHSHLLRDTLRDRHGCDSTRLRAAYFEAAPTEAHLAQILGHLSRLSTACLADHDKYAIVEDSLLKLLFQSVNGKPFFLLSDCLGACESLLACPVVIFVVHG